MAGCTDVVRGENSLEPPSTVEATMGEFDDAIIVSWNSGDEKVTGTTTYNLYRSTAAADGEYKQIGTGIGAQSYIDSRSGDNLEYGQVYYYKVRKRDGDKISLFSKTAPGYLSVATIVGNSLEASQGVFEGKVKLNWDKSSMLKTYDSTAFFYRVYYHAGQKPTAESPFQDFENLNQTEVFVTGLQEGVLYQFLVQVVSKKNDFIKSDFSLEAVTGYTLTPSPVTVEASKGTIADSIEVSWSFVNGVEGYMILYKENLPGENYEELETVYKGSRAYNERKIYHVPEGEHRGAMYLYDVRSIVEGDTCLAKEHTEMVGGFLANAGFCGISKPTNLTTEYKNGRLLLEWDRIGNTGFVEILYADNLFEEDLDTLRIDNGELSRSGSRDFYYMPDDLLKLGYSYAFKVRGGKVVDSQHEIFSDVSEKAIGSLPIAPPKGLKAEKSQDSLIVTWKAEDMTTCNLYYKEFPDEEEVHVVQKNVYSANGEFSVDAKAVQRFFEDGTKYYYLATATREGKESDFSNMDSGWSRVAVPNNFKAINVTSQEIMLEWEPSHGAAEYLLYREPRLSPIATILHDGSFTYKYTDSFLTPSTEYKYKIRAVSDFAGASDFALLDTFTKIDKPSDLVCTRDSLGFVRLNWSIVSENPFLHFKIYRYEKGSPITSAEELVTADIVDTVGIDESMVPGTVYRYFVTSYLPELGESERSDTIIGFSKMLAPLDVSASQGDYSNKIKVSWLGEFSRDVQSYNIYRTVLDSLKSVVQAQKLLASVACTKDEIMNFYDEDEMKNQQYYVYSLQANREDYEEEGGKGLHSQRDTGYISIAPVKMLEATYGKYTNIVGIRFERNPDAQEYWLYYRKDTLEQFKPLNFKNGGTSNKIPASEVDAIFIMLRRQRGGFFDQR